jgi:hypothetical protein
MRVGRVIAAVSGGAGYRISIAYPLFTIFGGHVNLPMLFLDAARIVIKGGESIDG